MSYISKRQRKIIKEKYSGLCAYSGTILEDDWQVDHIKPLVRNWDGTCQFPKDHCEDNMVPVQKLINHYKHSLDLETFRTWLLGGLHERLKKLPKNPKVEKSVRRKEYILRIASYFDITPTKPFTGIFYFESVGNLKT